MTEVEAVVGAMESRMGQPLSKIGTQSYKEKADLIKILSNISRRKSFDC